MKWAWSLLGLALLSACSAPPPPPPPPPPAIETPPRGTGPTAAPRPSPPPLLPQANCNDGVCEISGPQEQRLPNFPLPAPAPSARMNLARGLFGAPATLGDIDRRLNANLQADGYPNGSYFAVPDGFALVTAIERVHPDGTGFTMPDRWKLAAPPLLHDFNLATLFRQLRAADPGHYRVLVFLVTTRVKTTGAAQATFAGTQRWLSSGGDFLPPKLASMPLTQYHNISVLVYEFARPSIGADPRLEQSGLSAQQHLHAARLLGVR